MGQQQKPWHEETEKGGGEVIGTKGKCKHRKQNLEMHAAFHKYCLETKHHQGRKHQEDLFLKIQLLTTESHLEQRPIFAVITTVTLPFPL